MQAPAVDRHGLECHVRKADGAHLGCDEVAHALVNVLGAKGASVAGLPVVVRLDGTGAAEGRHIVADAGLPGVQAAETVWQAVQTTVAAAART